MHAWFIFVREICSDFGIKGKIVSLGLTAVVHKGYMLFGSNLCIYICTLGSFRNEQIMPLYCTLETNSLRCHFKSVIYILESVSDKGLIKHLPDF